MHSQTSARAGIRLSSHESHLKCSCTEGASKFRKDPKGGFPDGPVLGKPFPKHARYALRDGGFSFQCFCAHVDIALITYIACTASAEKQKTVLHTEHTALRKMTVLCNFWICLRPSLTSRTIHLNAGVQVQLTLSPVNGAGHMKFLPSTSNPQTIEHLQLPTRKTYRSMFAQWQGRAERLKAPAQ